MNLKNASDEDLKRELEEREKRKKAEARPKLVANPDFKAVVKMFEAHNAQTERGEGHDDDDSDFRHYVYEEVAKALYGPKYFEWFNKFR